MSIVRQDAWTNDEDLVLAEVVLRHIREGSTQLAAFEEVGERLSRTAAACGFRWNSAIRKKYEAAIAIAKKQRKNIKKNKLEDPPNELAMESSSEITPPVKSEEVKTNIHESSSISFDDVITFLTSQKEKLIGGGHLQEENEALKNKLNQLDEENVRLSQALRELQENYELMKQDYKLLIDIMDRAKQLSMTKSM